MFFNTRLIIAIKNFDVTISSSLILIQLNLIHLSVLPPATPSQHAWRFDFASVCESAPLTLTSGSLRRFNHHLCGSVTTDFSWTLPVDSVIEREHKQHLGKVRKYCWLCSAL